MSKRKNFFLTNARKRGFYSGFYKGQVLCVAANNCGVLDPTIEVIAVTDIVEYEGIYSMLVASHTSLGVHVFAVTSQFDIVGTSKDAVEAVVAEMQAEEDALRNRMKKLAKKAIAESQLEKISVLDQEAKLYD